jgi:hypothetical protein
MGTAVPGVKKAPKLDRFSSVRNMETRVGSNEVGRPIVRGAQFLTWTGCSRSKCRWPKGDRKADCEASSPMDCPYNWPDTEPTPGRESVLT